MIQSMTGYGKATAELSDKKINIEIKSLNSKAMDLSARIAPLYREKEMEIRRMYCLLFWITLDLQITILSVTFRQLAYIRLQLPM